MTFLYRGSGGYLVQTGDAGNGKLRVEVKISTRC